MTERLPARAVDGDLLLRLWRPDDAQRLHEAVTANLEHLRPWMPWISYEPLTIVQRRDLIVQWTSEWEHGGHAPMAMLVDGEVVGGTGYVRRPGFAALEVGYWVHVDHLGRGYATRSTRALVSAVFDAGLVDEVEIHHDKANLRSARVPERLGFTFLGERPDPPVAPAEVGIDCAWRITPAEWLARRTPADRDKQTP